MHTRKDLKGLSKAELVLIIGAMGDVAFSESATKDELINLILAQEEKNADPPGDVTGEPTTEAVPDDVTEKPPTEVVPEVEERSVTTLTIRAKHESGFYRCGRFWPHAGREIALSELSDQQVAALMAEPCLIVE